MSLEFAQGNGDNQQRIRQHPTSENYVSEQGRTVDTPVSLYQDVHGVPYAATLFGLSDYQYIENHPALAKVHPEYNNVNALNEYVVYMMRLNGLNDNEGSYNEILDDLYAGLKISKNVDEKIRLAKLARVAILRMKSEKTKARYKIIQKQYGSQSTKHQRSYRAGSIKLT